MLNIVDELMMRMDSKIPSKYLPILQAEMSELITYYDIQEKSRALTVYEGYLPDAYNAFMVTKKIEGKSEETLKNYARKLKGFFRMTDKPLETITANDVRAYLYTYQKNHGVCNHTLDSIRAALCSFFSWCAGEGYIEKNIMMVVRPIKYERKLRGHLSAYELAQLRDACESYRDKALIEVLYSTACRVAELVRLDKSDVDFDKGEVSLFGKGNKHRTSYLTPAAKLALQNYLDSRDDDNTALFVSMRKPHHNMSKAGIEKIVRTLGRKAGINRPVFPHLIRHTSATLALQHGMDVTEIQRILGHVNVSTTMIYAEVDDNQVKNSHQKYLA